MKYLHALLAFSAICIGVSSHAQNKELATEELQSLYTSTKASTVSIHDPSVVYKDGQYTVWGSHLGVATSTDLIRWTSLHANGNTFRRLSEQGSMSCTNCSHADAFNVQQIKRIKNHKGEWVNVTNIDAEAYCNRYAANKDTWIDGDMWAPDIIYNESLKKWCMYLSLNGDNWSSIIVLLTSDSSTGPWTYQAPIVMGGFNGQTYNSVPSPRINETDYTLATGESTLPSRYKQSRNGDFWPNPIDPCVFYDEEGELWMAYGSWSGGIFLLKLDKETGLRDYTHTYPSEYETKGRAGLSDPYYGKKIAGGCYVSGEGPYIQHIGQYYYLFMSYGGFAPDGGYEMRIFRSTRPDGPYQDAMGRAATYNRYVLNYGLQGTADNGMKLLGAYNQWGNQTVGECAQGHNSACTDGKGRSFVVYHTKFNDGTVGHQVRVHQLFTNEKGWLVQGPFAYQGETTTDAEIATGCPWTKEEIAGDYHIMIHPYRQDHKQYQETKPSTLTLTSDGRIQGDHTGTWKMTNGTAYITLTVNGTAYYGVLCEQQVNGSTTTGFLHTSLKGIAFTAVANSGVPIWGYKLQDDYSVAFNYAQSIRPVKEGARYNVHLNLTYPTTDNTTLTWLSTEPSFISETGKYNPSGLTEDHPLTLTERLQCGNSVWEQSYNVWAAKETLPTGDFRTGLVAYYDMDALPCHNAYNDTQRTFAGSSVSTFKPILTEDANRTGKQLHQFFGAQGQNSYTRIPNPLYKQTDLTGLTVSMWVKRNDTNAYDAIWGFFNSTNAAAETPRLYLTGNSYVGFNNHSGRWFDVNHPSAVTSTHIPTHEWAHVTLTIGKDNGVRIYINGISKLTGNKYACSDNQTTSGYLKNYSQDVVDAVTQSAYFYLGMGSFWGSADCYIDDVMIYQRELPSTDVRTLYTMLNRVYDFSSANDETAITQVHTEEIHKENTNASTAIYDLTGRRRTLLPTEHGVFIIRGKKVIR